MSNRHNRVTNSGNNTQGKINRALQKALNELCPKHKQDEEVAFFPDMDTLNCYAWIFHYKGYKFELVCNKKTLEVTKVNYGKFRM